MIVITLNYIKRQFFAVAVLSVCAICFTSQRVAAQAPAPVGTENHPAEYTRWAFKTNALLWVAAAPNLGAEFRLGRRFSLAASGTFAKWSVDNRYALQGITGSTELKYWFGTGERPLTGWHLGAWSTAGWRYDVQRVDGWQGNRFHAGGITGGYSFAAGRRFNVELSASPGWFYTPEMRHYHGGGDALIWQQTRYNTGRFMFKCAVNLVWLHGRKKR